MVSGLFFAMEKHRHHHGHHHHRKHHHHHHHHHHHQHEDKPHRQESHQQEAHSHHLTPLPHHEGDHHHRCHQKRPFTLYIGFETGFGVIGDTLDRIYYFFGGTPGTAKHAYLVHHCEATGTISKIEQQSALTATFKDIYCERIPSVPSGAIRVGKTSESAQRMATRGSKYTAKHHYNWNFNCRTVVDHMVCCGHVKYGKIKPTTLSSSYTHRRSIVAAVTSVC